MQKYQQYYQEMIDQNKILFDQFLTIHDLYVIDQQKYQNAYNEIGKKVVEVVKSWENKLCSKSEGGGFGKYSHNLADKFKRLLKKGFAYYDFIGCK